MSRIVIKLIYRSAILATILAVVAGAFADGASKDAVDWAKERKFWSFQKPIAHPPPPIKNARWPMQPLDRFILSRLEREGLTPSPAADRRTLIRRLTFDLTGLPPTPDEVQAFLTDRMPGAYERVVDRLLASPRYGERMASIWLPVARYGEDQAHQVGDDTKFFYPNAYKYRDWVIGAFNRDLPYDQFIRLQLAADRYLGIKPTGAKEVVEESLPEVKPDPTTQRPNDPTTGDLAALGFLGLGPKYYNRDRLDVMSDEWEDRVDTVTRAFLGLTVSCARCHNHKFDPITTEDYYALAGVFASTKMINRMPDGQAEKGGTKAQQMNPGTLHVVEDGALKDLHVFIRGNVKNEGPLVRRRFLRVLCEADPTPFKDGSGRRDLAEAIANPANPLTARVMVNRVWGMVFGKPIVSTPSNFGRRGTLPTHPELLDDLAVRFMKSNWSVKKLVREMVLSSTYRQSSSTTPESVIPAPHSISPAAHSAIRIPHSVITAPHSVLPANAGIQKPAAKASTMMMYAKNAAIDPTNSLLWRMNRRRLTVEQWRDAALYVCGQLKLEGPNSPEADDVNNDRRTVCSRISRLNLNGFLALFDYPDANIHSEKRSVTTMPTQKLFMLNSPFMLARARALVARLSIPGATAESQVQRAYRLLFGRDPDSAEAKIAIQFLRKPATGEMSRWEQLAQILLASNEMMYLD